ncbi:unconventional myosin-XVIIIa-like isoform X2 [Rhopilema esculentum]|uniref:unconventional myosin-XVIIIa-like isoform X2 n=1 Tax=Rhopilema esculentum TaxID=499914 RepID=UPI0031D61348
MFKKWKDRDNEKEKKDKKDQNKRDASRNGKEKKSFVDVLAGFENISTKPGDTQTKEKSLPRRTLSEKRRQERFRREELFRQQAAAETIGGRDFASGVNTGQGIDNQVEDNLSIQRKNSYDSGQVNGDKRPIANKKYEVILTKNIATAGSSKKSFERQESIKVASGSEVTLNIGLTSEIMAGLDNGTRDFLAQNANNKPKSLQGVDLSLPELSSSNTDSGRILHIKRLPVGDFGFALRRSTLSKDKSKIIYLAEPVGDDGNTGLLPGDRLIEVNGRNMENCTHDMIIDMISASGSEVVLKVVPVPELADFTARSATIEAAGKKQVSPGSKGMSFVRSGSMKTKRSKTRTETEIASEKAWLETEKVWLTHSEGFSAGRLINKKDNPDDTTCTVKLDHGGEVVEVDEEQISKANPPQYDRAEDLASLRHLNEAACLHTLRQRFGSNLIHTYGGPNLLVVNPREELGIYNDKVIDMFRGCKQEDMPPHIYAMAQTSYRNMQAMRMDQSIILLGRSGSGKTTNLKHLLHYYANVTSSIHSCVNSQKIEAALCLLDSFGSAKTYLCNTASRCSLKVTLEYDMADLLIGANFQTYLLEKTRIARRPIGESSFKIFYDLILGCDEKLRKELFLDPNSKDDNCYIDITALGSGQSQCVDRWMQLQFALEALDISSEEARGLWAPVAAIYHLGAAGVSTGGASGMPSFVNHASAQKAANILGTTDAELSRIIFSPSSLPKPRPSPERNRSDSAASIEHSVDAEGSTYQDALDGFVMGLYVETFSALIRLINRAISTTTKVNTTLQILDSPGFQDPISVHPKGHGASFEDLCYNYACEKLHWFLHFATFTNQLDRYNRENIDCNFEIEEMVPPNAAIATLDKLNADRRSTFSQKSDPRGVFWILEDEAMKSNASEIGLVEKIMLEHGASGDSMVKLGDFSDTFKLAHLQKTVDVTYCTSGWLKRIKEHPTIKVAYTVLAESKKPHVADLYVGHRSGVLQVEIHRTRSVKKRSAHGPTLPAIKKNSACMLLKMQMDSLLETLRRTNCRFVHCFLPDVNAGVPDSVPRSPASPKPTNPVLDVPLLRKQFRSSRVLHSIRMHRQGYPEFMPFGEFRRRFEILLPRSERQHEPVLDEKQVVEKMVEYMELDKRSYRIGVSQIFFRSGSFAQLEDSRDEKLNDAIQEFQAHCLGYLGRKKLKQLRVQHIAVKCLQRNIKKYMAVQNWTWWKLYTKVLPLLDVHRTEEELKSKTSELGLYKNKVEKLESENKDLNDMNMKLRKKVNDLSVSLSQVQSSVANANELLESESTERLHLEEEVEKLREENEKLTKEREKVETELLEAKVEQPLQSRKFSSSLIEGDESEEDDSVYKAKYKALSEEVQNLRQKLLHEVEGEIETLTMQKRQAEKQLAEEQEEAEDCRRQMVTAKRKLAKYNEEMEDMKLILETSHIRNAELEKKQRKFDQEMNALREELNTEKQAREDTQKEKNTRTAKHLTIENELLEKDEELRRVQKELNRMQQEFDDLGRGSFSGDTGVLNLKRDKRELELKVQEQEEELDEQAGQIQMLEQAKLKLEMASQRDKQQFQKDLDSKDDEMEQMRADQQRKMRQLEEQIEEEYREKNEAVKMRRELERRMFDLQHSNDLADRGHEKKLRKELRKLRILYKDAKYALDSQASQNTDKTQLKQLRNQLEDMEFAKHIAVKAKKQLEADIEDLQKQLEEMSRLKLEAEERNLLLSRENAEIINKIEDGEDETDELIKKNKHLITEVAKLQSDVIQCNSTIQDLSAEKDILDAKVQQLTSKLAYYEETTVDKLEVQRLESKIRELESKIDVESTLKNRLESQLSRLKNTVTSLQDERDTQINRESRLKAEVSKYQRQLKDAKEEVEDLRKVEDEQKRKKESAESEVENLDQALSLAKTELNLANKRIRDLQDAVEREMAASSSDDDDLSDIDSETGSISSRFSSSRSLSVADRRAGHYDRSTRLQRRLTALEDESSLETSTRKTSLLDDTYGSRKYSRTNSRDSSGSYGSRYLNGHLGS